MLDSIKGTESHYTRNGIRNAFSTSNESNAKGKRVIEDHFDHAYDLENNLMEKGKFELLEKVQAPSKVNIH